MCFALLEIVQGLSKFAYGCATFICEYVYDVKMVEAYCKPCVVILISGSHHLIFPSSMILLNMLMRLCI
jgi:hypothetical protein